MKGAEKLVLDAPVDFADGGDVKIAPPPKAEAKSGGPNENGSRSQSADDVGAQDSAPFEAFAAPERGKMMTNSVKSPCSVLTSIVPAVLLDNDVVAEAQDLAPCPRRPAWS